MTPSGPGHADLPPTRASLAGQMRDLGVPPGATLLVHASLRAVGWVCGGATAVVQALLDVLGPEGTLVVPTFTSAQNRDPSRWTDAPVPREWWPTIRDHVPAFDPAYSPGLGMGAVSEQVRTWPGAARSDHPHVSFAAVGPAARDVVAVHDLECHLGERSPLRALEAADARVLLLGVGWERCTAFHLAEYRRPHPPMRDYEAAVRTPGGRAWVTFGDLDLHDGDFDRIGAAFEASSGAAPESVATVRRGQVGGAQARLFPIRAAVDHAEEWMRRHRP